MRFSDLTFKRALLLAAARVAIPTIALVYRDATCDEPKKWRPQIDLNVKYGNKRDIGRIGAFGPIVQTNDLLSYVDFRFMADSRSNQEGNFGLGHRWLDAHLERIWGGYVYYDRRKSNLGNTYNQLTLGLECLSLTWDYRANVYLPESKVYTKEIDKKTEKKVSYTFDIEKIQTFEKITLQKEVPLKGIDLEVGRALPGLPHLRLYTGVYYYQGRAGVNSIKGYSIRARYDVNTYVSFQAEATHDTVRKRNVYIGLELRIPLGKENAKTRQLTPLEERMTLAPVRDVDIVANNHTEVVSVEHTTITKNGIITFDGPGAPRDPSFKKGHAENPYLFTDINHPELKDAINQTHVKHVRIPEGSTLVIIEIDTFKNHVKQSKAEARKRPAPIDVESIFETTRRQRRMSRDVDAIYSGSVEAMRQQALADATLSSANRERIENTRNHAEYETKHRPLTADEEEILRQRTYEAAEEEILRQRTYEAAVTATAARGARDNVLNDTTYSAPVEAMRQQALADAIASSANRERIENARNHAEYETKLYSLTADDEEILRQRAYEAAVTATAAREARDNVLNDTTYSAPVEAMRQQALADALASSANRERIENARNHAEHETKRRPLAADEEEILRQQVHEAAVTATAARESCDNALNDVTYNAPVEAMRQQALADALASSANRERIENARNHAEHENKRRPLIADEEKILRQQVYEAAVTGTTVREARDNALNDATYSVPVEAMRQQALADALASSHNRERIENARNHAEYENKRRPLTVDEEEILRQWAYEAAVTATAAREARDNALNDATYSVPLEAMRQRTLTDALASSANRERIENARNHAEYETKRHPLTADEEEILGQQVFEAAVTATAAREARDNALNDATYSVPVEAMRQQALADAIISSANRERIENERNHAEYKLKIKKPLKPKTYTTPEKIRNIIEQTLLSQPSLTDSQQKQLKMIQQKRSWDELVSTPSSKSNTEIKRQIKLEHNRNYTPINDRDNQLKILMKNDNPTSKELIQFKLAKQQWDEQCMDFDGEGSPSNPLLEATPSYKKRRDDLIETKHDDEITIAFATGGSRSIMGSQSPIKSVDDYYKNIESSQPSNDGDTHDLNEKFSIVSEQKMLSNLDFNKENGSPNILTLTKQNLKKLEKQVSDYRIIKTLNSPIDLGFDSDRSPDSGSDLSSDRSPDSGSDLFSDRSPDSGSDLSSDRSPDSGSYFGENDEDGL